MRHVKFPLIINEDTGAITYPDDIALFSSCGPINGTEMVGFYSGELLLDDYIEPHVPNPTLSVTADQTTIALGEPFNITVEVKDGDAVMTDVNNVYYVPIIRESDGKQVDFITVNIVNGSSKFPLLISEKGIYVINTSAIKPTPTATLVDKLELIVI